VRLVISYDPESGCAYVRVGASRYSARTVELDSDTWVDYDEEGDVIGVEFIGVSTPEVVELAPRRSVTIVPVRKELL
jgi:uncharacterized protein YuzE